MPSRREFFKTATGLMVGFNLVDSAVVPRLFAAGTAAPPVPGQLDTWLRIEQSGAIKVFTGKVDIGMGVRTCLTQVMAEELDVPISAIELIMGDTANTPDQGGVGGSNAISVGAKPMRNAAATARFLLVKMASDKLGVPVKTFRSRTASSVRSPTRRRASLMANWPTAASFMTRSRFPAEVTASMYKAKVSPRILPPTRSSANPFPGWISNPSFSEPRSTRRISASTACCTRVSSGR